MIIKMKSKKINKINVNYKDDEELYNEENNAVWSTVIEAVDKDIGVVYKVYEYVIANNIYNVISRIKKMYNKMGAKVLSITITKTQEL
jgi:hypothetical protein